MQARAWASKLVQALCEMATKKSKVLSNWVFVRTKLQARLQPLGVQATRTERNLGIDFASGRRVATEVRRARLEKSEGRVRRIKKIHGKSWVPGRRRLAQVAHAPVAKANHNVVAVTGLNETQLQQSRLQTASCLAKRMHGKGATMVLMMAGSELDPVFDSLAPVIALTHAVWDRLMPLATLEKCVRKAQLEQRENARPWAPSKALLGQPWQLLHACSGLSLSMIPSCGACTTAALLTREESARTACRFCSIKRRERGNGGVWRCMRTTKTSAVERS